MHWFVLVYTFHMIPPCNAHDARVTKYKAGVIQCESEEHANKIALSLMPCMRVPPFALNQGYIQNDMVEVVARIRQPKGYAYLTSDQMREIAEQCTLPAIAAE